MYEMGSLAAELRALSEKIAKGEKLDAIEAVRVTQVAACAIDDLSAASKDALEALVASGEPKADDLPKWRQAVERLADIYSNDYVH